MDKNEAYLRNKVEDIEKSIQRLLKTWEEKENWHSHVNRATNVVELEHSLDAITECVLNADFDMTFVFYLHRLSVNHITSAEFRTWHHGASSCTYVFVFPVTT